MARRGRKRKSAKQKIDSITGSGRNTTACLSAPKVRVSKSHRRKGRKLFGGVETPSGLKRILSQITPPTVMSS